MPDGGDATDYPSRILDGAVDVALRSVLFAENEGAGPLSLAFSPGSRVTVADSRFVSNRGARVALARVVCGPGELRRLCEVNRCSPIPPAPVAL